MQPIIAILSEIGPILSAKEIKRTERFQRLRPPFFSGGPTRDAQGFLSQCHRTLHTLGIVELNGVDFTTF